MTCKQLKSQVSPMKMSAKLLTSYYLLFGFGLFELAATASWHTAGRRYLIEDSQSYNWLQALDQCSRQGLQLAVIDSSSKSTALISLLQSLYGSSVHLWLGHHDEFNAKKNKSRSWYSASTGQPISYAYWNSGQPNNLAGEHCVEIYGKTDFKWNDENCDKHSFGYICEEHYQTAQCRLTIETMRQEINQTNLQLSNDFFNTQNKINEINENTRLETDNLLVLWMKSSSDILDNFNKSLNELIRKKPYLEVIFADVGKAINGIALESKEELTKIAEQTRLLIEDVHRNGENLTSIANSAFDEKLTATANEIDGILKI